VASIPLDKTTILKRLTEPLELCYSYNMATSNMTASNTASNTTKDVWNKKEHWAPFAKVSSADFQAGSLLEYSDLLWNDADQEWRDVGKSLQLELTYKTYQRGRNSVHFIWEEKTTGATFPMFLTDVNSMIQAGNFSQTVKGYWVVVKRGSNFGIQLLEKI